MAVLLIIQIGQTVYQLLHSKGLRDKEICHPQRLSNCRTSTALYRTVDNCVNRRYTCNPCKPCVSQQPIMLVVDDLSSPQRCVIILFKMRTQTLILLCFFLGICTPTKWFSDHKTFPDMVCFTNPGRIKLGMPDARDPNRCTTSLHLQQHRLPPSPPCAGPVSRCQQLELTHSNVSRRCCGGGGRRV